METCQTCKTCGWWHNPLKQPKGVCRQIVNRDAAYTGPELAFVYVAVPRSGVVELATSPYFACNMWEAHK